MLFIDFRLTMWAQILVLRCTSDVMSMSDRLAKSNTEHGEIEMLTAYPASAPTPLSPGGAKRGDARAARKASWLDLLDPTQEERASVESTYGLKLPSREEL